GGTDRRDRTGRSGRAGPPRDGRAGWGGRGGEQQRGGRTDGPPLGGGSRRLGGHLCGERAWRVPGEPGFLPAMIEAGSGSVIVIGSISGKRPVTGRSAYTTTKLALVGLTRTLAQEAGPHGIRVNLISPGFVEGPRIDWVIENQAEARGLSGKAVRREMEE